MKTTIDLPDEVLRSARERAASLGVDVNQFIAAAIANEVKAAGRTNPISSQRGPRSKLPTIQGRGKGSIPNLTPELQAHLQEEEDLARYKRSFGC